MTARTDTPPSSRRARRAADRRQAAGRAHHPARPGRRGSPLAWLTAVAGVAAIVLIGGLVLLQGGATVSDAGAAPPASPRELTATALADGRSLGRADAPVTLELWSDFQCPACGQFARIVEPALVREFVAAGTLRIVHHDAAFQGERAGGAYDESVEAGAAARCAAQQGKYWPFHDWLFANQAGENQGAFARGNLERLAGSAGLDLAAWKACLATGTEQAAVRAETQQGVEAGIAATPTLIVNGVSIVGLHGAAELGDRIRAAAAAAGA